MRLFSKYLFLSVFLLLGAVSSLALASSIPVVQLGVVFDRPSPDNPQRLAVFVREIKALLAGTHQIRFSNDTIWEGDGTRAGINRILDQVLADPQVSVVLMLGPAGSSIAAYRGDLPKPVIAPFIVDQDLQALSPSQTGKNLFSAVPSLTILRRIELIRKARPFRKAVFLVNSDDEVVFPDLEVSWQRMAKESGFDLQILRRNQALKTGLKEILEDRDAVLILRGDDARGLDLLLSDRAVPLPVFTLLPSRKIEYGVTAGFITPQEIPQRLARRVAGNVQRILNGEDAASLPAAWEDGSRLVAYGDAEHPFAGSSTPEITVDAEILDEGPGSLELSLPDVLRMALAGNLSLRAAQQGVAAGAEEVNLSRSKFLPQVDLGHQVKIIDQDRAVAAQGQTPQRNAAVSATIRQTLFDQQDWADIDINRSRQTSREEEWRQAQLDLALQAATEYLNILRSAALVNIRRENLRLSQSYLQTARRKHSVGQSSLAEVYRWEREVAMDQKELLSADAQMDENRLFLKQLLHLPLTGPIRLLGVDINDEGVVPEQKWFAAGDPPMPEVVTGFWVQEAARYSGELRSLDALIAAKRHSYNASRNAFWSPTVGVEGAVAENYWQSGAGSPSDSTKNDRDLTALLKVTFPFFTGGAKSAVAVREDRELQQLRIQREALGEDIERRIRSAARRTGASYAGIRWAQEAAEAARKSYELTAEAYVQGTVSALDLLDAQNAARVSEETAATARYDFLTDYLRLSREAGHFGMLESPSARSARQQRFGAFLEDSR